MTNTEALQIIADLAKLIYGGYPEESEKLEAACRERDRLFGERCSAESDPNLPEGWLAHINDRTATNEMYLQGYRIVCGDYGRKLTELCHMVPEYLPSLWAELRVVMSRPLPPWHDVWEQEHRRFDWEQAIKELRMIEAAARRGNQDEFDTNEQPTRRTSRIGPHSRELARQWGEIRRSQSEEQDRADLLKSLLERARNVFSLTIKLGQAFQQGGNHHVEAFAEFHDALLDLRDAMRNPPDDFEPVAKCLLETARIDKMIRAETERLDGWARCFELFPELKSAGENGLRSIEDPFAFVSTDVESTPSESLLSMGGSDSREQPTSTARKKRGRKKANYETVQAEQELADDWARARDNGVYKADYAKDKGMTTKELDLLLDRVAARKRASE